MQTTEENEQQHVAPDPQSQPLQPVSPVQDEDEDDPEVIFAKAVAEIDTQPLIHKKARSRYTLAYFFQDALCLILVFIGVAGIILQAITYPHTLVILYTKAHPASITTPLDVPTRSLTPVTITRSATIPTTGTGYQKATKATGYVTFYNGLSTGQTVPAGTVLTGRDGEHIVTTQDAVIPAADTTATPPTDGYVTVSALAVQTGSAGNIAAYDVSVVFSASLTVKNLAAFTHGQNARTYQAVAAKDLSTLTLTVNDAVTQAFTTAFPVQPGEEATITACHTTLTPTHRVGEEATSITLTVAKTCSAIAYNQSQLIKVTTAAFTKTRPAATYHIVGSLQITLKSVKPLTVSISGKWAFTFSQDYQDLLAEHIQGDDPAKARAYLLKTGVISYTSIPNKLPAALYINFLVLIA